MNCHAEIKNDVLTLENNRIRRRVRWNQGNLLSLDLTDLTTGHIWRLGGYETDCAFPGEDPTPHDGKMEVIPVPDGPIHHAHLRVDCSSRFGGLEIRRSFRLYDDCPAIACDFFLRGRTTGIWQSEAASASSLTNIENLTAARQGQLIAEVLERMCFDRPHLHFRGVQFFDITDRRNNLVSERAVLSYVQPIYIPANLLLIADPLAQAGIFILKEAPCSDVQLTYPGCDFVVDRQAVRLVGAGIAPRDITPDRWTRAYSFVTGVGPSDEKQLLTNLRGYQQRIRRAEPGRDHMIMLNTWGDRSRDARLGEAFALAELEAGARLCVTHFQLDDGWQQGVSSNSASSGGTLKAIWRQPDYWHINPERFPNGLAPITKRARELSIELCLWFNPSTDDSFANWQKDADVLIQLFREHGVRTFKIDGVTLPDKTADINFRAMLDRVLEATNQEAVFNLDVTAGRRGGYHYLNDYGNLFLENRYTDWSNYYPHWTLRNLWLLARYVPPQSLQIEFLNKWRNTEKYAENDPLAPCNIPFDYCFAVTMMAQPLAWFEASNLPPEAFEIAPLVRTYREHQERIHAGRIFPIGQEPSGTGWTGFQSQRDDGGYLLFFREFNDRPTAAVETWSLAGREVELTLIAGQGKPSLRTRVDDLGRLSIELPGAMSFGLYTYRLLF
ncbi:MAG: alpha-galactosidase [Phycisphaeraceae bacterium]|nr:alpha-galactosidase [Phycisphaeraceae bacterium]